ncbi:MAG: UDP-galactose-lipid carrier transferase [Dehalococcoidia bacterium]|nr:UDP-galactose-lipid carrier transferase [Dehalococcoidia bacterium]
MLENADPARKLAKHEYSDIAGRLRERLYEVQKACWESGVGSVVVFEGWDAAGKGTAISALTRRLEPRGFRLHPIQAPRTHEQEMPWLWRFWNRLPNYGEMAIFDQSWYGRVFEDRVAGLNSEREWQQAFSDITEFERAITDDGYVLIKVFLHISRKEQARRLKRLARDPLCAWQLTTDVWRRHRVYAAHEAAAEEMLERTGTEWGPWTIVDATNRRWATVRVFETIIRGLEAGLQGRGITVPEHAARAA